jgi:hypothetical protein
LREEEERNRHTPPCSVSEGLFFAATSEDLATVFCALHAAVQAQLRDVLDQAWGVKQPVHLVELVQVI